MFHLAQAFNQDLSNWNVSEVTDMTKMFYFALALSGKDLSGWSVANVAHHNDFMTNTGNNIEPNWN